MKKNLQSLAIKLCTLCLFCSGAVHWKGISLFLFGEREFPKESDY